MEHGGAGAELDADPAATTFERLSRRYDAATVRTWARAQGMELAPTGGLARYVYALYEEAAAERDTGSGPVSSNEESGGCRPG